MITAANAVMIRQQAIMALSRRLVNDRPVIKLPEIEPLVPTKWVVLKDRSIAPAGGGVTLIKAGTEVNDIVQMLLLAKNDVELAALE